MSECIYAVLPYDSGFKFDPEDIDQCVWDYDVCELGAPDKPCGENVRMLT